MSEAPIPREVVHKEADEGSLPRPASDAQEVEVPNKTRAGSLLRTRYEELSLFFSGPLPHPLILKQYEETVPGSADRIIRQAETQTHHRIQLEKDVIAADIRQAQCGLWAGLFVATISIVGGCTLVAAGHDWAGAVVATATVVSLVAVFVYGSQSRKQERLEKAKVMAEQEQPAPSLPDAQQTEPG